MNESGHDPNVSNLMQQLAQWDREKRLAIRIGGLLAALCLTLAGHALVMATRPHELVTNQLLLKDRTGLVRARLMLDDNDNPRFQLFDSVGREQFVLSGQPDSSAAMTFYEHGLRRVALVAPSDGQARLEFPHQDVEPGLNLIADEPAPVGSTPRVQPGTLMLDLDPWSSHLRPEPASLERTPSSTHEPRTHRGEGSPV